MRGIGVVGYAAAGAAVVVVAPYAALPRAAACSER